MKKFLSIFASLCLVVGMFAGCSKGSDEKKEDSKSSESSNEITFMIPDWGDPGDELLKEFEKDSGIKVKVIQTSWDDIRDKISTAAAGKTVAADVFEVDWSWVGEFKAANWVTPIDVDDADKTDMPTLKTFTVDDKVYALPYANDFRVGFYNTEMYKKAGLTTEPKTWEEVIANSQVIKDKKVTEYPVSIPLNADENTTTSLLWLAYTRNGKVFNDDNTINKESVLDALTIIDTLVKKDLVNPANRNSSGMDAYGQISAGTTSFLVGPSSFVGRVNDEKESKVVGQVMPIMVPGKGGVAKATVPFAEAIGVSNYTKNKDAAMKFAKWYTSKETQAKLFEKNNTMPTRNSVLDQLIKDGKMKNTGAMQELAKIIESPFPNGVPTYYTKMSTEIFNAVNQMANGKLTPQQATDQIAEKVDALAKEAK